MRCPNGDTGREEEVMKAMFVNEDTVKYADLIVSGRKTIETRKKNMLKPLVGERVAVVSTRRSRVPMVVGYVNVQSYMFCPINMLNMWRSETCIPVGDSYDNLGKRDGIHGKWFYELSNPEPCAPFVLPADAGRHGRSWCEI